MVSFIASGWRMTLWTQDPVWAACAQGLSHLSPLYSRWTLPECSSQDLNADDDVLVVYVQQVVGGLSLNYNKMGLWSRCPEGQRKYKLPYGQRCAVFQVGFVLS